MIWEEMGDGFNIQYLTGEAQQRLYRTIVPIHY